MNFFSKNKNVQESMIPQPQQEWIRHESLRQQRPKELMTPQQLQRTREAKRLAETKRNNLEESIERLRDQQEWLHKYAQLTLRIKEEKKRLCQLNKEQNLVYRDEQDLQRFESFESIQGDFERMCILKRLTEETQARQTRIGLEVEALQQQWEEQLRCMKQSVEENEKAVVLQHQAQDHIAMAHTLEGQINTVNEEQAMLKELVAQYVSQKDSLQQQAEAQTEENELLHAELERLRAGKQSIEMHENTILHAKSILVQLDYLSEVRTSLRNYTQRQKERDKKQNEFNEQLRKAFSQYQEAETQMQRLNEELQVHRREIKGLDSFQLQERAMQLKSRRQMLLSALSLWNRISFGYNIIEEKKQHLNALRLKIEHTGDNLRKLNKELDVLEKMAHEKEYTYLLSKGQDVIQLRADLKEGTNCPVCGASHHPYHSDTMLEQSKLINAFKTEYELLHAEFQSKDALRTDLRLELSEMQGLRKAEEATLLTTLQRQEEDVKEWQLFSTLDSSFQDCTASTNREARLAMIRQLIANAAKDVEEAQTKLDTFNFRQNSITELSEKIANLELQKSELSTWLNEVNTSCQVVAGQIDYIQESIDHANRNFRELYEAINTLITIPDWLKEWENNCENLKQRILQLADSWESINKKIAHTKEDLQLGKSNLESILRLSQATNQVIDIITARQKMCANNAQEYQKQYKNLMGSMQAKDYYQQLHKQAETCRQNLSKQQEQTVRLRKAIDLKQGHLDVVSKWEESLKTQYAAQRQKLDLWIHNYNAQHPPVQYTELEHIFQNGNDWNAIRLRVHTLHTDIRLCQSKIEQMQAELTVMQAENGRISLLDNDADMQESLVRQRSDFEQKLHDITLQIARLDIALEEHEKATLEEKNIPGQED